MIIRVPATSANIGPGFDSLGLSVNLYNYFKFSQDNNVTFINCEEKYKNEDNLVYIALKHILKLRGQDINGIKIEFDANIPPRSGLGSSAACIVAGILAGNEMLTKKYSSEDLFKIALEIEGHGDNLISAFYGGLNLFINDDNLMFKRLKYDNGIKICIFTSNIEKISTKYLRDMLPKEINIENAVFNIRRAMLLANGLENGEPDFIKLGLEDKIHEPYRGKYIDEYEDIKSISKKYNVIGTTISGSGPSLIGFYKDEINSEELISEITKLKNNWKVHFCEVDYEGAKIL